MKKLSKITEGILGDIARRDLAGNKKKEDESLENLFKDIIAHCKVENDKLSTLMMIDDEILFSNMGTYEGILYSMTIIKPNNVYDIEISVFVGNKNIIPELYPYFEKQYDGNMINNSTYGSKIMKIKIRRQGDVMNFIYDLIDHLDKKMIIYHK